VSYAAFAGPDRPPPCGDNTIYDPFTLRCHCAAGLVFDPRSPNDCVDPSLPCPGDDVWSESAQQCVPRDAVSVSIGPAQIIRRGSSTSMPGGASFSRASVFGGTAGWLAGGAAVGGAILYFIDRRRPKAQRLFG
jgi:hypothetical protein